MDHAPLGLMFTQTMRQAFWDLRDPVKLIKCVLRANVRSLDIIKLTDLILRRVSMREPIPDRIGTYFRAIMTLALLSTRVLAEFEFSFAYAFF